MDEPGTTQVASDPASDGVTPSGSETPGSTGGSHLAADTSADERAQLELRARQEQGRADRAEARLRELEARLNAPTTDSGSSPAPASEGLTLEQIRAEMKRQTELATVLPTLRERFPYAGNVLARSDDYDSTEALTAAAEEQHESIKRLIEPAVKAEVDALKERYAARFGPLTDDIAPPGGGPSTPGNGLPSKEELAAMSFSEYRAFADAHPDYIQSLMRTA